MKTKFWRVGFHMDDFRVLPSQILRGIPLVSALISATFFYEFLFRLNPGTHPFIENQGTLTFLVNEHDP